MVGLGLCVIDHLYLVDELDTASERTRYRERLVEPGGMTSTALVQAARLGCRAELISAVGDDADGRLARRRLREAGVSTRRLVLSRRVPTTIAVVLVRARDGERRFLAPHRAALERRVSGLDLASIRAGTVLLVDGHFPSQARRAVRRARRVGAPVVGDFSDPRPEYEDLLAHVDYPVLPEAFVRAWVPGEPADAVRRLHERYGGTPVVTLGRRGGLYWDAEARRVRRFASPRVRVVDTTGAGDAFHGAFAAGLAHGLPLAENVARAARVGALVCTALGGRRRLASRREWAAGARARGRRAGTRYSR